MEARFRESLGDFELYQELAALNRTLRMHAVVFFARSAERPVLMFNWKVGTTEPSRTAVGESDNSHPVPAPGGENTGVAAQPGNEEPIDLRAGARQSRPEAAGRRPPPTLQSQPHAIVQPSPRIPPQNYLSLLSAYYSTAIKIHGTT